MHIGPADNGLAECSEYVRSILFVEFQIGTSNSEVFYSSILSILLGVLLVATMIHALVNDYMAITLTTKGGYIVPQPRADSRQTVARTHWIKQHHKL